MIYSEKRGLAGDKRGVAAGIVPQATLMSVKLISVALRADRIFR
jgi:hypothetical protein